ncbi:MAG TPA: hypothetical protein VHP14_20175 [Anaerolineales bacterium]|nr:hypothetical protein [Anaerolineales bacterium]
MKQSERWSNRVVVAAVLLTGFGATHLIDDFLYGLPADFGLSNELSQAVAVVYFIATGLLLVLASRGSKAGYIGNMGFGLFLLLADSLKHGSEGLFSGSWRSGWFSRSLAFSTLLLSIGLVVISYRAWRLCSGQAKRCEAESSPPAIN